MPSKVSTKRKVIGGSAIALGIAETTVGAALTAAGSAPVPNPLLVPGLILIGKGCTTTATGLATIKNYKEKEAPFSKFLRTNPTIPTIRISKPKPNVTPAYISATNDVTNLPEQPTMRTPILRGTLV